jgi:hypothetical protein
MILFILISFLVSFIYTRFVVRLPKGTLNCGLTGYSGKKPSSRDRMALLIWDNEERGVHSTGVYSLTSGMHKKAETASKFLKTVDKKFLEDNVIIAHTRHATMGAKNEENAHPYEFGEYVGAHNGWLIKNDRRNEIKEVCGKFGYDEKLFNVDSKLIFHHISQQNSLKAVEDIEGAMALSIIHEGSLWLYRRESKPLYFLQFGGSFYYSSRKEGLEFLLTKEQDQSVSLLPANTFFKVVNGFLTEEIEIAPPKIEIKMDEVPSTFNTRFTYSNSADKKYWTEEEPPKKEEGKALTNIVNISNLAPGERSVFSCLTSLGHWGSTIEQLDKFGYKKHSASVVKMTHEPADSREALLVVKLSDTDGASLEGWQVRISGHPSTTVGTLSGGFAGMTVPNRAKNTKSSKSSLRLMILPPPNHSVILGSNEYLPKFFYESIPFSVDAATIKEIEISVNTSPLTFKIDEKSVFKKEQEIINNYYELNRIEEFKDLEKRANVVEDNELYKYEYVHTTYRSENGPYGRQIGFKQDNERSIHSPFTGSEDDEPVFNTEALDLSLSDANEYMFGEEASAAAWGFGTIDRVSREDVEISLDSYGIESEIPALEASLNCIKKAANVGMSMGNNLSSYDALNQAYLDFFMVVMDFKRTSESLGIKCVDRWSQFSYSTTKTPSKADKMRAKKSAMIQATYDCESLLDSISDFKLTITA